jgi:hypothetical protein
MKSYIHLLLITCFTLMINACSNNFLDENLAGSNIQTGESAIIIAPYWEEASYLFSCPITKNAEFTIVETPKWLQIETKTGNLSYNASNTTPQSIGAVNAKAKLNPAFAKTGIYIDFMKVEADGVMFQIPVYYITEGTPKVNVNRTLTISYNSYINPSLLLTNTGNGILLWDIISMPAWLDVNMASISADGIIIPKDGHYAIPFIINTDSQINETELSGTIVLRTNDKENPTVNIQVTANLGSPVLLFWGLNNYSLDFAPPQFSYSFDIQNNGNGLLAWQFTDLPDWLSVNKINGNLTPYLNATIEFNCDKDKLAPGLNSATIQLKSNDPNRLALNIDVNARGAGNNILTYAIEGRIVDAAIDRSRNLLIYAISQPNKLVFYDLSTRTIANEIPLSKAPTCFTYAEDFSTAAVGHGGMITAVDLSAYSVTKTIELSNTVYDIIWADSTLYCYTELTNYSSRIFWVDIANGTITSMSTNNVDGKTKIKKVPDQPFIIATRQQSSPSGFITYSINERKLQSYAHKDLSDFWFSEDGDYIFARSGDVYRTTSATNNTESFNATINAIDKLKNGASGTQYYPWWLDHLSSKNKIFIINYHYANQFVIYQFDDNDYQLEKSYAYDKNYELNASTPAFEVQAHYVFANREGTELFVLRKGKADDNMIWSMEILKIE